MTTAGITADPGATAASSQLKHRSCANPTVGVSYEACEKIFSFKDDLKSDSYALLLIDFHSFSRKEGTQF